MRLLRDLWATSPRRTGVVACLIVLGAAGQAAAAALAGPVLLDRSTPLFAVLATALAVAVLSDVAVGLIAAGLTADWAADVRGRLGRAAFGQDLPSLEAKPVGELLDRIDGDVHQVATELRVSGVRIIQAVATGVLAAATALFVWWPAALTMLLVGVLLVVCLNGPARGIAEARTREEEAWSDLAASMEESIHGQDDVRTSLGRPYVLRSYAGWASRVLSRGRQVWELSARLTLLASFLTRGGIIALVVWGGWALSAGHLDTAGLTAVWLLALAFGATVEQTGQLLPKIQHALGAWARVRQLLQAPQEPRGGAEPADGDLTIRGLSFRYGEGAGEEDGGGVALREVNLTFRRGRSYAVIGRTGAGKSTLTKVLTRSVAIPRGTVFLGGRDLLDLDLEGLRRWIAVVPQRTEILAGTVAENVALFDPALLDAAPRALEELGLTSWVAGLPDGLETRLGEGGHLLSAGQEQLVAFARILVREPRVVILDEATARMDPETESRVQRAAERLLRGRIGIVVAHRLSSVRRCDEVVVLADGEVVEAGPMDASEHFARLLASSEITERAPRDEPSDGREPQQLYEVGEVGEVGEAHEARELASRPALPAGEAPPLPEPARARTLREIVRLAVNDPRYGLSSVGLFMLVVILGLDGAMLPWLWADLVDGSGGLRGPVAGIVVCLLLAAPLTYFTGKWYPEWWTRQTLRIGLRLVHGQTGPRRVSPHTPAEVVAQGGDTERVVSLTDHVIDQFLACGLLLGMTALTGSVVPALFFAGSMLVSGFAVTLFGPLLDRAARRTIAARAAFATALVSCLSAVRTVKLAGASRSVVAHLAGLDAVRSDRQRREVSVQVLAQSTPAAISGLLPIAVWALYLSGGLSAEATLVAVSTLGAARWFAWTTASLAAQFPSARVWTRRTVSMCGAGAYSAPLPGVDLSAGTAPAPRAVAARRPLRRLELDGFCAVHEDGTVGVRDVQLTVQRGQLVLVMGAVGSGKSSLLRALAGIVHHTGDLRWNGRSVSEPEDFLRPQQVGYVAQLPRVLSGTVADNIRLGHALDPASAVTTAQLDHDLAAPGSGLGLRIGHKGARLSGGQLQRLALARALAPRPELLIADDVSSALDVTTELELWSALRADGVTVLGSTSKRAALGQADTVLVLSEGKAVDQGPWSELRKRWDHLAG